MNPQFRRESLAAELKAHGSVYVFLGKELGARSHDPDCYKDGKVQFDRLAKTERFREGVERVLQGMESYRVALLCAEREPLACHRTILVLRHLAERVCACAISLSSTETEDHPDTLQRLLRELELDETNLFQSRSDRRSAPLKGLPYRLSK